MIVYGDLGIGKNSKYANQALLQETKRRDFAGIIHMGDIGYNLDTDDGHVGDDFMNSIQPFAATYSYLVSMGNHEYKNNATHFRTRFKMPVNDANQGSGFFYSFNLGAAHWIFINTELYSHESKREQALTQNN